MNRLHRFQSFPLPFGSEQEHRTHPPPSTTNALSLRGVHHLAPPSSSDLKWRQYRNQRSDGGRQIRGTEAWGKPYFGPVRSNRLGIERFESDRLKPVRIVAPNWVVSLDQECKPGLVTPSICETLSGSAGMGFTPHVITIGIGEDIAAKIMSFSQQGPRVLCILSANGAVSTVTLRQPSTSGGTVTYEGRFEIICLSGSYSLGESGGSRNRAGGLSVSLASPDGRVIGGGVGGALIAATPVQVIVGSFMWGSSKSKYKKREAIEGVIDSDHQAVDHAVAMANEQQNQNLTPTSSVTMWPSSQSLDMRNAHMDIDLMRG